jgi:hypothetical protein
MNAHTRRAVAYIAGRLASDSTATGVSDLSESSRRYLFSGRVNTEDVNVYDHDTGCHIAGAPSSLYHFGNGAQIELSMDGAQFSGHDFDSGHYFHGSVQAKRVRLVRLYDFEHEADFLYEL